ncbi:family 16 glycosylhydrolase [Marinimicrobium sp. ABcell2]|uniref:family 16 glycosylhydrolase n=1 Tax=Marinimicrobium sp. ABcell2 TaxID=3069751 RepID=UPI0027B23DC7|nr:family 16 glycosylhydrolase [Marinimicrobium sp. ABcell2]MDQ2077048.1 family 16 glycosylhydrolase [Marinimicrobium sp. ABcell2]
MKITTALLTLFVYASLAASSAFAHNPAREDPLWAPFNNHDSNNWLIADGYKNNDAFFGCYWSNDRVGFSGGQMTLSLASNTSHQAPYQYDCAEYATHEFFGYGLYEVSMRPAPVSGVVSSFFTYTGPYYGGAPWDEIDIEFLGNDTSQVQFNYYTNGVGGNEIVHQLGFNAADSFNTYAFEWHENYINWYVNGQLVATATENIPSSPSKIMMNIWNTYGLDEWTGPYYGQEAQAVYEWVRFTPYEANGGSPGADFQLRACDRNAASSGVATWECGVGSFDAGQWIRFDNVDLSSGYNAFAVSHATTVSGSFEIRLGSPNGTTIGTVNYSSTGGWGDYQWNGTPSLNTGAQGVHDIYIVMTQGATNISEFWFKNE